MGEIVRILLVDHDGGESSPLEAALATAGYRVKVVTTLAEALRAVGGAIPDTVAILDKVIPCAVAAHDMPLLSGTRHHLDELLGLARAETQVATAHPQREEARNHSSSGQTGQPPLLQVSGASASALARLASEALRVQEEERRKLSLEMHDDVAQIMGNLGLMMDACLAVAPEDAGQLRQYLRDARDTAREGFHRAQRFSIDLRPPILDDLGLAPTILWYAERFFQETGIPVEVRIPDRLPPLDGEQETALFRIVQQALQNVRRHAQARRVDIAVESRPGWLRLVVSDDGVGIDRQELALKLAEGTHLGLAGMRYRTELLGGRLDFTSAAGAGTTIVAEIPVRTAPRRSR